MKSIIRGSLFVTALLALLAVSALAQDEAEKIKQQQKAELDAKVRVEIAKAIGTQFGFETKVVKGAPYSATAEAETVQTLADGNRIRNKTTTTIYRDSEGRTRREIVGKAPGVAAEVFISDPTSGANYSLYPERRVAVKSQPNLQLKLMQEKVVAEQAAKQKMQTGELPVAVSVEGRTLRSDQLTDEQRAIAEKKLRMAIEMKAVEEMKAGGKIATVNGGVMLKEKQVSKESLGQQMVEGVMCEGRRSTVTIPANTIGNELPINIVSEEWYSPELQVLVLTKQNDPRMGETTYRLTNIHRNEPDRSMFDVPSDYTIKEQGPVPMMKKKTEEQ